MEIVDICRVFHPTTRKCTFFYVAHGNFSKLDHILGHKVSLEEFKKMEITPCNISDHDGIKPDLNNKRNHRKYSNTRKLNNTQLNDHWLIKKKKFEV
jgi:hypothetical protein